MERLYNRPVLSVFLIFAFVYLVIVILMLEVFKIPSSFFLHDDGYYDLGRKFFYGNSGLAHEFRPPLFPLLLSVLNFFPLWLQPVIRISFTLIFTLGNLFLANKIFSFIMTKKQIFYGTVIFVLTPLYFHWTLKSTPEVYLTFFLGMILFSFLKFYNTSKPAYLALLFASMAAASFFKPVFFFVSVFLLLFCLINKKWNLSLIAVLFVLYSLFLQLSVMNYSKPDISKNISYGFSDLVGDSFFVKAIFITGRFDTGSHTDFNTMNADKSNLAVAENMLYKWINDYMEKNPDAFAAKLVTDAFFDHPGLFILAKLLSPVFFLTLASGYTEMAWNALIQFTILFFAVKTVRKMSAENKTNAGIIIFLLVGYYATYFFTFSIARYSVPFMFYFSVFISPSLLTVFRKKS